MTRSLLLSEGFVRGLALLGAAILVAWLVWERSGRGRALSRLAFATALVVASGATAGAAVNHYYAYFPTFSALTGNISPDMGRTRPVAVAAVTQQPAAGRVEPVTIPGSEPGIGARRAYVYLPPGYESSRGRYPVLYLIHGSPGTPEDWIRGALVDRTADALYRQGRVKPMIIVTPDANGGFLRNSQCLNQVERYLASDVVSWIDTHYRTIPDRLSRGIGGVSTGGYCATNIGLRHSEEFSVIISHSGEFSPAPTPALASRAQRAANDPVRYVRTIGLQLPLWFYADAGLQDRTALIAMRRFSALVAARSVAVQTHEWPAERHNWRAWTSNAAWSLQFASEHLQQETASPPSGWRDVGRRLPARRAAPRGALRADAALSPASR